MADFPNVQELTRLAIFLAPGFVVLGVRNRFKDSEKLDLTKSTIIYAIASSAYYAAISPFFNVSWGMSIPEWIWSFLQYFLLPLIIGIMWVLIDRADWFYRFCEYANLNVVHHIPTAWDWAFRQKREPTYVEVRLKNGENYYGTWTDRSFASSTSTERDLYLDQAWSVNEAGEWSRLEPHRSLLICGNDVSVIKILGSSS